MKLLKNVPEAKEMLENYYKKSSKILMRQLILIIICKVIIQMKDVYSRTSDKNEKNISMKNLEKIN